MRNFAIGSEALYHPDYVLDWIELLRHTGDILIFCRIFEKSREQISHSIRQHTPRSGPILRPSGSGSLSVHAEARFGVNPLPALIKLVAATPSRGGVGTD